MKRSTVLQFLKYLVSGGVYFWSGYAVFAVLWSGFGWRLWWAKLAANICGWSVNFMLQRLWVFNGPESKLQSMRTIIRYALITAIDFLIDYLIVAGLRRTGVTPYVGQFISAGVLTFWNYYWYRFWVFPIDKKGGTDGA